MPLLILLAIATVVFMFLYRRSHDLSRDCRWRPRRLPGQGAATEYTCVACGATHLSPDGQPPRVCLNPQRRSGDPS
ncbi:hypothetical protein [Actibacterium sp.]|uniref:hypothetical protein n=1 Tax=Actibacterium sp. TaxID=1872125 RepID=UPI00356666E1